MLKQPGSMSMLTKLLFHVFVISVLSTTNYSEVIGSRYDGRQGTDYHFPTDTMHMTPTDGSDRFRRASDGGFHENVNRMTMLARVLTGISLQNGLIDGSIPGDEAIAEMLNIGSVKLADLETFDKTKVDTFLANLKDVSGKLDGSSADLENDVFKVSVIREKWMSVTGLDKLPKQAALDKIYTLDSVNFTGLSNELIVKPITENLQSIPNLPDDLKNNANNRKAVEVVEDLQAALARFDAAVTLIKTFKSGLNLKEIQSVLSLMDPFVPLADTIKFTDGAGLPGKLIDPKTLPAMKSNLQLIGGLSSDQTSLATAHSLLSSLSKHDPSSIKYTTGFVDGFHDLVQLPAASKNSWVLLALNTSMPIGEGLKPLELFKSPMSVLGRTLSTLKDLDLCQSVEEAFEIQRGVQESVSSVANTEQVVNDLSGCVQTNPVIQEATRILKEINNGVIGLKKKLNALEDLSELVKDEHVSLTNEWKNAISWSDNGRTHDDEIEQVLPNLKKMTSAQKVIDMLGEYSQHFEVLQTDSLIKTAVDTLRQDSATVINLFNDRSFKGYFTLFKCLADVNGSVKEVSMAARASHRVSALKGTTDLFEHVNKVTSILANCTNDIKTVRAIPGKIKTSNSSEVKELTKFKNLATDAKMVGDAAAGVIAIQKAAAMKTTFQELITLGQDVVTEIGKVPAGPTKIEIEKGWGDFAELKNKLEDLLVGLKNRVPVKGSTLRRRLKRLPTDFQSLSQFCAGQAGLIDVVLNVDEKITALDSLIVVIRPPSVNVNRFRSLLPAVGQLDLQFTRHNGALTGLSGVLTSIQNLFATVQPTRINPGGGSNPGSPNGSGGSGGGGSGGGSGGGATGGSRAGGAAGGTASATEAKGGVPTWVYPTVACVVIFIVAVIVGFWYKRKRDKKAKELEEAFEKEKEDARAYIEKLSAELIWDKAAKKKEFEESEAKMKREMQKALDTARQLEEDVAREEKLKEDARRLYEKAREEAKNMDKKAKNKDGKAKKKDQTAMKKLLKDYQAKQKQVEFKTKELKDAKQDAKRMENELKHAKMLYIAAEANTIWKGNQLAYEKEQLEMVLAEGNERVKPLPLEDFKRRIQIDEDFQSSFSIGVLTYVTHRIAYRIPCIQLFELNDMEVKDPPRRAAELFYMQQLEEATEKARKTMKESTLPKKEMRNPKVGEVVCHQKHPSMVLPSSWYYFRITRGCSFIVSQLPLPGPQQEEFYRLVGAENVKNVVYFGTPGDEKNFPTAQNEQKDFGRYRYEAKSVEVVVEGELVKRELHSVNATTSHNFTHYEFLNWQDEEIPKTKAFRDAFEKAHRATRRDGNTMVYDRDGSFKAGVFAAVEAFAQEIIRRGLRVMELGELLVDVNRKRYNVLTKGEQVFFIQLMAVQICFHDLDGEIPQQLETQWAIFEAFNDEKYDKQCREMAGKGGKLGEKPKEAPTPRTPVVKKPKMEEKSKMEASKQQEKKEKKEKKEKTEEQVSMVGTVAETQCDEVSAKGQI